MPSNYTTTTREDGLSVFTNPPEDPYPKVKTLDHTPATFSELHVSPTVPVSLIGTSPNYDLTAAASVESTNKSMTQFPPAGAVFRRTDMPPGRSSPFHRTMSVDYGVLVEGTVTLVLESGERRTMKVGDTVVQRATMHQWINESPTEWVRMVWVMLPCEPFEVDGKEVKEEWRIPKQTGA